MEVVQLGKKISLVFWDVVCADKSQGELGVLNLKTINSALLAKWWYRFIDPAVLGKWKEILEVKYGPQGVHVWVCFQILCILSIINSLEGCCQTEIYS